MERDNYWEQRWQKREMGWNIGYSSPPLCHIIDHIQDKNASILIPGCGNAYEAQYLLESGFSNITLLDISETVVNNLKEKFKPDIHIFHQNFFEHSGNYDYVLEQTFFCALDPSLREQYVDKMYTLLNPEGILSGVLFSIEFEKAGPPFGGTKAEYVSLFSEKFEITELNETKLSIPQRLGNELYLSLKKCRVQLTTEIENQNLLGD